MPLPANERTPVASDSPLDVQELFSRLDGDAALIREVAECFLLRRPQLVTDLHSAFATIDKLALERAAHEIKGAAANLAAIPVCRSAARVEAAARASDFTLAREALATLEEDTRRLEAVLTSIVKGTTALSPMGGVPCAS